MPIDIPVSLIQGGAINPRNPYFSLNAYLLGNLAYTHLQLPDTSDGGHNGIPRLAGQYYVLQSLEIFLDLLHCHADTVILQRKSIIKSTK